MSHKKLLLNVEINTVHTDTSIQFLGGEVAEVDLISAPIGASQTLAKVVRGYSGIYTDDRVTEVDVVKYFKDIKNTKLTTPLEFLNFVFLIRDVPRSFTHQLVRTRQASVVQESTRFIGSQQIYRVLVPQTAEKQLDEYVAGTVQAISSYERLLASGVSSQDARNILPHSLLTHLFWRIDLNALMRVYNQRWCCQAEPSTWLPVMRQVKRLIGTACGPDISAFLTAPIDRGEDCGFHASFDRPCTWRNKSDKDERDKWS